jgi:antitoxin ParD1/3/4
MTHRTLHLSLPDDLEAEVAAAVAGGEYSSAEDLVANAVAEWRAGRRLDAALDGEELRRLWRDGTESGPGKGMSIDEIKNEARRRFTQTG